MSPRNFWTPAEDETLVTLKRARTPWDIIITKLPGRNRTGAVSRFSYLCKQGRAEPGQATQADVRRSRHDAIIRAAATVTAPRDLTAALMGDPLPGRSALERRPPAPRSEISLARGGA
jgi:hypothetical protein